MPIEVLAIDNVTAAGLRLAAFHGTRGGNGIGEPADLQVRALNVPGAAVQVVRGPSGSAALLSRYPSAGAQTYLTLANETEMVPVPPTGSSGGLTRYVIQRINDPQFPGSGPVGGAEYALVTGSPSLPAPYDLGLLYPHIVLARITQPANTATITQAMITDLRVMADPREDTVMRVRPQYTTDPDKAGVMSIHPGTIGEQFPDTGGAQYIDVPAWATRMQIEASWLSVVYPPGLDGWGEYWVEYGPVTANITQQYSTHRFRWNAGGGTTSDRNERANWLFADEFPIPASIRGKNQVFFTMRARRAVSTQPSPYMNEFSGIIFKVRFLQVPDLSDS